MAESPFVPVIDLPASPDAFREATWEQLLPYFEALADHPLADPSAIDRWLATWSRLETLISEAGTLAMIAYTADTANTEAEQAYLRFSMEIFPRMDEQQVRLARRLLDLGWKREDMATTLHRFRTDIEIFREANVERFAKIEELSAAYQKITGGLSVDWDGTPKTIPQLQPLLKERDRAVRERAFRLGAQAYLDKRDEFAELFDRMYALRVDVAREAGFADFQQYCFAAKHRFDYTPADTARFHDAVKATVTPAVARLHAHRRRALQLDPSLSGAHYGLAFLLIKRGRGDEAIEHLEAYLATTQPGDAEAARFRAHAQRTLETLRTPELPMDPYGGVE